MQIFEESLIFLFQKRSLLKKHFVPESGAISNMEEIEENHTNSGLSLKGEEVRDFYLSLFEDKDVKVEAQSVSSPSSTPCSSNCDPTSSSHASTLHHQVAVLSQEPISPSSLFIPPSNPGYKILRRLGWIDFADTNSSAPFDGTELGAGGIGRKGQGRRFPIATVLKTDRRGIGADNKNRSRITHFAPKDTRAVEIKRDALLRNVTLQMDRRLQERRIKAEKRKEMRFRQEFYLDENQLRILYCEHS